MTVLLSINSKYIHTLLSVRYLKNYLPKNSYIYETNINVSRSQIIGDLYRLAPSEIAISCYIFNIEFIKALVKDLRVLMPSVKLLFGGYEAATFMGQENCFIMYGEGEHIIAEALKGDKQEYYAEEIKNLDDIVSPYSEDYIALGKNKILYFESSRGCPFSCSYCMSGGTNVRNFSLKRVTENLDKIMKGGVKQIKFVDRTFNADIDRAYELLNYIIKNYHSQSTNFHFEMTGELFSEKLFSLLSTAPKGLIQFEIGVQSFNEKSLAACNRYMDGERVADNIKKLLSSENIHIHTDLIAGLPYEDKTSFEKSFNKLYELKSDMLQLGFLKLLPGSELLSHKKEYGYEHFKNAPYEIVKSDWLSYGDIIKLKSAEMALDRYYNSGKYKKSLDLILPKFPSQYEFYEKFGLFLENNGAFIGGISAHRSSDLLYEFTKDLLPTKALCEAINEDYISSGNIRKWKRETEKL